MLTTVANLLLIILGFGVLIFVHELGHFLAAKWAGIRTEAFAIGMGTPVCSWRKGVGFAWGSTTSRVEQRAGKSPRDLSLEQLERLGIGMTEYSLRWLPIGGFVKMLGQDDADPNYVSSEPGSYNVCPVGKRMVVVSAGVVANIILAVVLFIAAFLIGVPSYMPVIGAVATELPAGTARAINAEELGIAAPGLQPGDRVTYIDGKAVRSFVDLRIAGAMAKPGQVLAVTVERPGVDEPLQFLIEPQKDAEGLLGIGVAPSSSTRLVTEDEYTLAAALQRTGLAAAGVEPGMRMIAAGGRPVETYEQFEDMLQELDGRPVPTVWASVDRHGAVRDGSVSADVPASPVYQVLQYPVPVAGIDQNAELGLVGLTPLVRISAVDRLNRDVLRAGDVVLRIAGESGPRSAQLKSALAARRGGEVDMVVLRDGREESLTARVDRKGRLQVAIELAWDVPLAAKPMSSLHAPPGSDETDPVRSPVADLALLGRTALTAVDETPVADWPAFREALRRSTASAHLAGTGATVQLTVTHPTPEREAETLPLELSAGDVEGLHALGWESTLSRWYFEPLYTTLSAHGNPLRAVSMGFEETWKVIVMTYLTIDRLVRGSVGVEQIRGPVGIVHIGTQIADRGLTYLVFFLGIISVNLAVINFLPIPIVDGGLFLFLVYEKLKGRPPSLAFQNAATIVGVALIATALLVVTWNDLVRLVG